MAWGCGRQPEPALRILPNPAALAGKDLLDMPCGAARWAIGLAKLGVRPIGVDLSREQLRHARRLMEAAGVEFPLLCGSAEEVPLPDACVDLVLHDASGVLFYDPRRFIAEVGRLLRPGGRGYLLLPTPLHWLCDDVNDDQTRRLARSYFQPTPWTCDGWRVGSPDTRWQLPYGAWIRLFRQHSLQVEDLVELQAPLHSRSSFVSPSWTRWARRWPLEAIWVLQKDARP